MIKLIDNKSEPMNKLHKLYNQAEKKSQKNIEALCIGSFCVDSNKPSNRIVNIKYIQNDELIFFSNYKSKKAAEFEKCNKVACIFYWNTINCQIRIEGEIKKTTKAFSDKHFKTRSQDKNILSIVSSQSQKISSFQEMKERYEKKLKHNHKNSLNRPIYWGGYKIIPNYFEFWKGHNSRLNKREVYEMQKDSWINYQLQP